MNASEIRSKTIRGLGWSVVLSGLIVPAAMAISMLLGRQGPQVLGSWASLNLLMGVIGAFLLFGGSAVLVRFLPLAPPARRLSFLVGYALVVGVFGAVGVAIMLLLPALARNLASIGLDAGTLPWFVAIVPVTLAGTLMNAALWAHMEIKWTSVIGTAVTCANLFGLGAFLLLAPGAFARSYREAMMIVLLGSSLLSVVMAATRILRSDIIRSRAPARPYLPKGFWRYSVFLHLVTIVGFLVGQSDQALVLGMFSTASLGIYKAAIVPAEMVRWFPQIANATTFPAFSNLIANNDRVRLQRAYSSAIRLNRYFCVLAAAACVLLGPEVLSLFGRGYREAYPPLVILASSCGLAAITVVGSALTSAAGRTDLLLAVNALSVAAQIAATRILAPQLGIAAAAWGRAAAFAVSAAAYSFVAGRVLKVRAVRSSVELLAFVCVLLVGGLLFESRIVSVPAAVRLAAFVVVPVPLVLLSAWRSGDAGLIGAELANHLKFLPSRWRSRAPGSSSRSGEGA